MQSLDWRLLFDQVIERNAPADKTVLETVLVPISAAEIAAVTVGIKNPWPANSPYFATYKPLDPTRWFLPRPPIPAPYIDFLRWSDGASWQTGDREFSCFGCKDLREYTLAYHFPEYMPGALPIGLDGGGVFGVFDLREGPSDAVWVIGSGALSWEDAVLVNKTFVDFCRGRTAVGDVYREGFVGKRSAT